MPAPVEVMVAVEAVMPVKASMHRACARLASAWVATTEALPGRRQCLAWGKNCKGNPHGDEG